MSNFVATVKEVAKKYRVTPITVRNWVAKEVIPPHCVFRMGRTYRFDLDGIEYHFRQSEKPDTVVDPEPQTPEDTNSESELKTTTIPPYAADDDDVDQDL